MSFNSDSSRDSRMGSVFEHEEEQDDDQDYEHDHDHFDDEGRSVAGSLMPNAEGDLGDTRTSTLTGNPIEVPATAGTDMPLEDGEVREVGSILLQTEEGEGAAGDSENTNKKKEPKPNLWPELEEKFRPADVRRLIEKTVREHFEGMVYDIEEMQRLSKVLSDAIHNKVVGLKYERYKIITNVTIGERRGEGASSVTRCVWDPMSDCMATYTFMSDTFFCGVTVYGIYVY